MFVFVVFSGTSVAVPATVEQRAEGQCAQEGTAELERGKLMTVEDYM